MNALQGFMDAYADAIATNTYDQDPFNFNGTPAAVEAKQAYVAAFSASLRIINDLQRRGIAHYNPQYLQGAAQVLEIVHSGAADDYHGAFQIFDYVNHYGNLYNAGTFNWFRYVQQRQIGEIRAGYVIAHPKAFKPKTNVKTGQGDLVRQDFSDCGNGDVRSDDPTRIGGSILITRNEDGTTKIVVTLKNAAHKTRYDFYWKCVRILGDLTTDVGGGASKTFNLNAGEGGDTFSFDMYPSGAPAGNKYQSVRIVLD
jgi:hypothetical protein